MPFFIKVLGTIVRRIYGGLFRHDQWSIGVVYAPIHTFLEPDARPEVHYLEQRVKSKYLADPFGVIQGGKLTVLCEDFDYRS